MTTERSSSSTRKRTAATTTKGYPGPRLAEVQALTDKQVANAFTKLGLESKPLPWIDDDQGRNIARYATHSDISNPKVDWSEKDLAELKAEATAWHARCERCRLFVAYVNAWVEGLSDERLWQILADLTGEKASVSERRYTDRQALRSQVVSAVYAQEVRTPPQEDK